MAVTIGDKVIFHPGDGRDTVEAEIIAINEDDTVNLVYPHPKNEEIPVPTESVRHGRGAFQFHEISEEGEAPAAAPEAPAADIEAVTTERDILQARVQVLEGELTSSADVIKQALEDIQTITGERDALATERDELQIKLLDQKLLPKIGAGALLKDGDSDEPEEKPKTPKAEKAK